MQKNKLNIRNSHLICYDGLDWHNIHISNVVCIEKDLRKMTVYYHNPAGGDAQHEKFFEYFLNETLSSLIQHFDDRFFVCKRGCLINFEYVRSIEGNTIVLENNHKITLSRRLILKTIREYERYLGIE